MKNRFIVTIFMLIPFAMNAAQMEMQQKQAEKDQLPDWQPFYETIRIDYKNYLQKQLEEYKKHDLDFNELVAKCSAILKSDVDQYVMHDVHDKSGNKFIHIAMEQNRVAGVKWLYAHKSECFNYWNSHCQYPIDLCIKQLMPLAIRNEGDFDAARQIFDATLSHVGNTPKFIYHAFKKYILKKVFTLQLAYKKQGTYKRSIFVVDQTVMMSLVPATRVMSERVCYLSRLRQQATDETDGSTFTHVAVEQQNPDDLFELVQSESISLEKNKAGLTALDIAMQMFRYYTTISIYNITAQSDAFKNASCCFYILMNYLKVKSNPSTAQAHFGPCCAAHTLAAK